MRCMVARGAGSGERGELRAERGEGRAERRRDGETERGEISAREQTPPAERANFWL